MAEIRNSELAQAGDVTGDSLIIPLPSLGVSPSGPGDRYNPYDPVQYGTSLFGEQVKTDPLAETKLKLGLVAIEFTPISNIRDLLDPRASTGTKIVAVITLIPVAKVLKLAKAAKVAKGAKGRGSVLIDSNAVVQIGRDPTLGGRLAPGEKAVVSYVTGPELRNAVARGRGIRGVPRALADLPVLGQRPSIDAIIDFRGGLERATGRFGDGIIGAQAVEFGIPLITYDAELAAAVRAAGGVVR